MDKRAQSHDDTSWWKNRTDAWSLLLVAVQFGCLIYIAVTGPLVARAPWWRALETAGGLLAIWAILSMRIGNFNVTPDVRAGARFVERGPYRWIRHPMYSSLLVASLALVLDSPRWDRWLVWGILLANMVAKLRYEEQLLVTHFPNYDEYRRRTKRLVPYLY